MDFKEKQKLNHIRVKKLRIKATLSELRVKEILDSRNIKYVFQKGFLRGDAFAIVDFYIKKNKICLEIDGDYHQAKEQIYYDKWRDNYLKERGFKVIRIKNSEIESINNLSLV